jgi:hypothetical protein
LGGLRLRELKKSIVKATPRVVVEWAALETYLKLKAGTKGGRLRYVPIDTPDKRATLDHKKENDDVDP